MSKEIKNILVVDDDIVDVMAVRRLFKRFNMGDNYMLHSAENGLEALDKLRGNGYPAIAPIPRVILLDLNMPKMNGFEFLEEMRADPNLKHIKVIILTTSDAERDRTHAYKSNVAGYIIKPITLIQFIDAITTFSRY